MRVVFFFFFIVTIFYKIYRKRKQTMRSDEEARKTVEMQVRGIPTVRGKTVEIVSR